MRIKYIILVIIILLLLVGGYIVYAVNQVGKDVGQTQSNSNADTNTAQNNTNNDISPEEATPQPQLAGKPFVVPIDRARERVTKKPFGIYITPKTSPVQPERFSGYHTGTDFEVFAEEQNTDVPVYAVCDGKLLVKRTASGYGGVAVQSCILNNAAVTIVYGHVRFSSIKPVVGQSIKAGEQIALLGTGFSSETDGERKHLHLGIHKGTAVDIRGYVTRQADLSGWLNILDYIK